MSKEPILIVIEHPVALESKFDGVIPCEIPSCTGALRSRGTQVIKCIILTQELLIQSEDRDEVRVNSSSIFIDLVLLYDDVVRNTHPDKGVGSWANFPSSLGDDIDRITWEVLLQE